MVTISEDRVAVRDFLFYVEYSIDYVLCNLFWIIVIIRIKTIVYKKVMKKS